jgi:Uma2 family endonuclease
MEESTIDNPVLIVEVLSPSNKAETWSNVWTYVSIPSVREILIVRSAEMGADLLRRQSDGSWPAEPARIAADEMLTFDSIGFACPLRALYRTTRLAAR